MSERWHATCRHRTKDNAWTPSHEASQQLLAAAADVASGGFTPSRWADALAAVATVLGGLKEAAGDPLRPLAALWSIQENCKQSLGGADVPPRCATQLHRLQTAVQRACVPAQLDPPVETVGVQGKKQRPVVGKQEQLLAGVAQQAQETGKPGGKRKHSKGNKQPRKAAKNA